LTLLLYGYTTSGGSDTEPERDALALGGIPYFYGKIDPSSPIPTGEWAVHGSPLGSGADYSIYHGLIEFEWKGRYPLFNARVVPDRALSYDGDSSAADDYNELFECWSVIYDWNGTLAGTNKFPCDCQLFEEVGDWDPDVGEYTPNCYDESGEEVVRVGCVPCLDENGAISNWKGGAKDPPVDERGYMMLKGMDTSYPEEGGPTLGGIYVAMRYQKPSDVTHWKLLTAQGLYILKECFSVQPTEDGIIHPGRRGRIWIAVYIPFSVKKGGIRSFDLKFDYVTLEAQNVGS
jgi:hypothetical protein